MTNLEWFWTIGAFFGIIAFIFLGLALFVGGKGGDE